MKTCKYHGWISYVILFTVLLACFGCTTSKLTAGIMAQAENHLMTVKAIPAETADWIACGNSLATNMEGTLTSHRGKIGNAKENMLLSGGIVTFIGVVSSAWISTQVSTEAKSNVGLGAVIGTSLVGLYQVWQGVKKEPLDYVKAADDAIGKWNGESAAAGDAASKKKAYVDFIDRARDVKTKYPEWADFQFTNLCLNK